MTGPTPQPRPIRRSALRVAGTYALYGALWIILSDKVMIQAAPQWVGLISTVKGLLFITVTALLVYGLVHAELRERVKVEGELAESRAQLRRALDEAPWPLVVFAEDGELLLVNRAVLETTGYRREELPTIADWMARAQQASRDELEAKIARLPDRAERSEHGRYEVRTSDGATRLWEFSSAPLGPMPDGRRAVLSMARDVTEQQAATDALQRLNAELEGRVRERTARLEAANQKLEEFSYSVSHDLRAPLRAVNGFAGILRKRYAAGLDEDGQRFLANILEAGDQMEGLIDSLLAYARVGRHEPECEPVDLGALFDTLRRSCEGRLAATGAHVNWPAGPWPPLRSDGGLLRGALSNLLDNALTYVRPGDLPQVRVDVAVAHGQVIIRVTDRGIGIAPEYQAKVFQPFQRLHAREDYPGTGIGLASAQRAVELLGGRIELTSAPGEGSVFAVVLPAHAGVV